MCVSLKEVQRRSCTQFFPFQTYLLRTTTGCLQGCCPVPFIEACSIEVSGGSGSQNTIPSWTSLKVGDGDARGTDDARGEGTAGKDLPRAHSTASQGLWDPLDDDDEGRLLGGDGEEEVIHPKSVGEDERGGEAEGIRRQQGAKTSAEEEPRERRPGATYTGTLLVE